MGGGRGGGDTGGCSLKAWSLLGGVPVRARAERALPRVAPVAPVAPGAHHLQDFAENAGCHEESTDAGACVPAGTYSARAVRPQRVCCATAAAPE